LASATFPILRSTKQYSPTIMKTETSLVDRLAESQLYSDYERAFSEATGLPLRLRSIDSWQLPHHGQRKENPFCAMMAGKSRACAACLQVQQTLAESARDCSQSATCQVGLSDTAVPVRLGDQLIGFLHTGQVFRKKPSASQFRKVYELTQQWGIQNSEEELKQAFF